MRFVFVSSSPAVVSLAVLSLAVASGAASLGCVYRTPVVHVPDALAAELAAPPALRAEDVTVIDGTKEATADVVDELRRQTGELLGGARRAHGVRGWARVRARVKLDWKRDIYDSMRVDGVAVFGLVGAPFGLVTGRERVSVDLSFEATDGRTFDGHGVGDELGSIYAPARRRALAVALDRALADADTKAGHP